MKIILFLLLFASIFESQAQNIIIKGKIIDAVSLDPVPFAAISFKNTSIGKNSEFDGTFIFQISKIPADSLIISCIGFTKKSVFIQKDSLNQELKIYLNPNEIALHEIKVYAGENPAYAIIRNAVASKSSHNNKNLEGYDFKSYNKVEVDINNLNPKLQKLGVTKKINKAVASVGKLTDEAGKILLPSFISESISHYYHRNNPKVSKEIIEKTNISGVGVTDGSLASQFIGTTFQQYNFFDNHLNILNKNFPSPIATDWKLTYEYYLSDSTVIDGKFCYQIDFEPHRKQDLAFNGTIWIEKASWAIAQIDATITKDANMNFVERIKIQQELEPFGQAWFPVKNRILIDVSEISKNTPGMLLKFTNYNYEVNTNKPFNEKFFDKSIEIRPDYHEESKDFWLKNRPELFSEQEMMAYSMIDSIKRIPTIKNLSALANIAATGYTPFVKGVELGHLADIMAVNTLEGLRISPGLRTNYAFSKKWVLSGYVGYGFKDQYWKYGGEIKKIFSRNPWTTLSFKCTKDIEQVGLRAEDISVNPLYSSFLRFGTLMRPYMQDERRIQFQREVSKGIISKIGFRTRSFNPLYDFNYREKPEMADNSPVIKTFNTSEIVTELKFQRDELAIDSENERLSLGTTSSPTITLGAVIGIKNVMHSNFNYQKFTVKYNHIAGFGFIGNLYYRAEAGLILGTIPYPLLKSHLGNESVFLVLNSFNLMNSFEFISDKYLSVRYFHDFQGLLFNKIPIINNLKLRSFTTGRFLIGDLSTHNMQMNPTMAKNGEKSFQSLQGKPYVELGYGISNIFKIFRVEAIHRLTQLEKPNIRKFGVKFSAEITL